MPCKLVKFDKYKHKKSTWITQGLLKSIRYGNKLYINLKTYNSIISAKQMYYESCFNRYGNDIRSIWKTINEILTKNKKKKFTTIFQDNNITISGSFFQHGNNSGKRDIVAFHGACNECSTNVDDLRISNTTLTCLAFQTCMALWVYLAINSSLGL